MPAAGRYLRLLSAFLRFGLARELAFRANFLAKVTVEVLWLAVLLVFYRTVFAQTRVVADWTEDQYLFFVGCYFALEGVMETFFLENCNEFAELVRTGELDFFLLQPIDEQFLVTCRSIELSTAPNIVMGAAVMGMAAWRIPLAFHPLQVLLFLALFACGAAIAYSFLLLLTSTSIWFVRNQSLYEMWWLFASLIRYPREIFQGRWASPMGWFFTFIVPVLVVVYVPAGTMVKAIHPGMVLFTAATSLVLLYVSRRFFFHSLRRYRSASS